MLGYPNAPPKGRVAGRAQLEPPAVEELSGGRAIQNLRVQTEAKNPERRESECESKLGNPWLGAIFLHKSESPFTETRRVHHAGFQLCR
jgi:hypothetical protein